MTKMTKQEALQKATVLNEIIVNAITEFNQLNGDFNLGLDLTDNSIIEDLVQTEADDRGWNTSNC
jgi:hypothetical protein